MMYEDNNRIHINDLEFDSTTGELIIDTKMCLDCDPAFSGIKNGRIYVNNRITAIDINKFQSLPKSIRERILAYPNSDYTRDILSQPTGSIEYDTFPNFKDISYTTTGDAIIMNDEDGQPTRAPLFLN